MCKLKLDWHHIFWLHDVTLNQILEKYESVLKPGLGKVVGFEAKISVNPEAQPDMSKHAASPLSIERKWKKSWSTYIVQEGTLEPVEHSEWAAPIVAVLSNSPFRRSLSKLSVGGGRLFTKLYLSQAYLQVPLDGASKQLVVYKHT